MPTMYRGRGFSVEVETIRFPNGTEHQQETVRHPPSVVLIPMQDAGHVVMIRQYRASIGRAIWELPAGGIRPGETAEAAAARECEEEIRLVPNTIERIRALYPSPGFCDEEMVFFRVSDLRQPPARLLHRGRNRHRLLRVQEEHGQRASDGQHSLSRTRRGPGRAAADDLSPGSAVRVRRPGAPVRRPGGGPPCVAPRRPSRPL